MSKRTVEITTLLALAAQTASGNSASAYVGDYTEAVVYIRVTAVTGTNPTLDLTVQTSQDDSNWFTHTAATQMTTATNQAVRVTNLGKYLRVNYTIGGTATPTFTVELMVCAKT